MTWRAPFISPYQLDSRSQHGVVIAAVRSGGGTAVALDVAVQVEFESKV